jgi:hypothetical protein
VAARTRGDVLGPSAEWIGIGLGQSSGALKDVLSEVAAWTEHDKWCASRSEE